MRAGIYMLISTSRLEKDPFSWKKAGKKVFFLQKRLEFYICHCWTPYMNIPLLQVDNDVDLFLKGPIQS